MQQIRHQGRSRRLGRLGLLGAVAFLAAACNPVFGSSAGPIRHGTLTSDSGGQYTYTGDGSTVTAHPPSPSDPSIREAYWRTNTPYYADQEACITWHSTAASEAEPTNTLIQPGIAMRIAPTGEDHQGVKAITVTENVWLYGVWVFNVHVWDSTDSDNPFRLIQSFDLSSFLGAWGVVDGEIVSTIPPPPWYICAQTRGDNFRFKVWTGDEAEPGWDDPERVFATTLPAGWDYPGYSGGYIGHLHEGQSATFSDLSTTPLCLAADMIGTSHCQNLLASTTTTTGVSD